MLSRTTPPGPAVPSRRTFLVASAGSRSRARPRDSRAAPGEVPLRALRFAVRPAHRAHPGRPPRRPRRPHHRPGRRQRCERSGAHAGRRAGHVPRDGRRRCRPYGDDLDRRLRVPCYVVVVYDNANGTPKPGGGTYGTTGSATTTVQADGFTARSITFANDFLRADHPEITGTQAVAVKVQGDRSASSWGCRFLGHQDTLYADSIALNFAGQYYRDCYAEGDVDFVFGRATAVFERCHFRTLNRTDLATAPYGFVFAPSTALTNPRGYLVTHGRVSEAPATAHHKRAPCPAWTPPPGPC